MSSGAFGSPAILERSGIGAKAVLQKCGVEQLVDLPGVGENYQGMLIVLNSCGNMLLISLVILQIIRSYSRPTWLVRTRRL